MPRRKYAPHLVTISETATMSVSKEKDSPIGETHRNITPARRARSKDARIERSHSAPPEAEASDRRIATSASRRFRSQSAKCLSTSNLSKPTAETRATSPTSNDEEASSSSSPSSFSSPSSSSSPSSPTAVPRSSNKYGRSSLHNAVRKGDKKAIRNLLETEPELLYKADSRGNHPLHYAASPNVPDGATVVYMLLKAGASVNALNDRHQTPLLISVISNDDDNDRVPRVLLYHHAKPMIKVTDDLMLAQYASSRGLHKIAAAIREYM